MVKGTYVDKNGVRKGAWTQQEDDKLRACVERFGHSNWRLLPKFAGLDRCGKGCRLRWMNHLKPGINRGDYTQQEKNLIAKLHRQHGNKWSAIAAELPGRTDHGVKNYWNARHKNRQNTTGEEAEMSDEPSEHIKSREASSQVFVLESSDLINSTVVPADAELGSDSSMEQSCSIASTATQDVDNSFWTQPFVVETDSYDHAYDFRECDGAGSVLSPLFDTWWDDVNHMQLLYF
ncbi:transcription factor MYB8-like [Salvia divinorum]|uniref:Transcription factor MYB8-like n=1 Tax=Salvia divinorum TaxID=28513 RepID=A0ABD1HGH4_SALDI